MAGERSVAGVLAGAGSGAGAPGLLGLLLAMEAGIPIPVPSDRDGRLVPGGQGARSGTADPGHGSA